MKKIALILLSAAILLSLCACGEKAPEASASGAHIFCGICGKSIRRSYA